MKRKEKARKKNPTQMMTMKTMMMMTMMRARIMATKISRQLSTLFQLQLM